MPYAKTTQIAEIPEYLRPYIVEQDASLYTAIDHASWRYILAISRRFFSEHAHEKYLSGLKETGISSDRIPLISEMDQCLRKFGWQAVAVSGFIPPAVFMEFLSLGVLPIACDMRKLENLAYTPAPDIVHEAAGHAPMIADAEYEDYLRHYGEVSRKAIFSKHDMNVYQAVRLLSDTKESPTATREEIAAAQKKLDDAVAATDHLSEAALLARMNWWTIEYGLVGSLEDPKIYGAGLLSSVGESYSCLKPDVKKFPLEVDCVDTSYDITRPQPQLFVTPDFPTLTQVLKRFTERMAYRQGGVSGLEKAKQAQTATTSVLDSGAEISGQLSSFLVHQSQPCYLSFQGPTQLAFDGRELENQGPAHHAQGFGTPVGRLVGGASAAELSDEKLRGPLEFESGVKVAGKLKGVLRQNGRAIIATFESCTVTRGSDILFKPEWGTFDMACGAKVVSVYGGAADRKRYLAATGGFKQEPGRPKTNLTPANRALNELYAQVRKVRDGARWDAAASQLESVHAELEKNHPGEWLLRFELLELAPKLGARSAWAAQARARLDSIAAGSAEKRELIGRGLELLASGASPV